MLKPVSRFQADAIDAWIFDLDNTIYPERSGLFDRVSRRMTLFIQNLFDLDRDRAFALQKDLLNRFGTTASGLMQEHNIDPSDFMAFVHDINLDDIDHDPELDQLLAGLPGTKVIFTNGTERHAEQILNAFGISHHFSGCYDIIRGQFRPKPDPVVYQELLRHHGITPGRAVMVEDMAGNLKPAYDLGITTVWLQQELDLSRSRMDNGHIDFIDYDLKTFLRKVA